MIGGPVSRATRYRAAGGLVVAGLLVEIWSLFQVSAFGFMVFLGIGVVLLGLGVALNVYWVSLELATSEQVLQTGAAALPRAPDES